MMTSTWIIAALLLCVPALALAEAEDGPPEDPDHYVKVEIQGKLRHGVFAIGGETTGTTIQAGKILFELDLGQDKELLALAKRCDGQTVRVTGVLHKRGGVEIKERWIVDVKSITPLKTLQ